VAVGHDGAVYVADWIDQVVGGHQMNDRNCSGTIYRIAPRDRKLTVPRLDLASLPGQVAGLKSPAVHVRFLAYLALKARGAAALPAVKELLADPNPYIRARAVWLAAQLGREGGACVEELLRDDDPDIRITAFRALRQTRRSVLEQVALLVKDRSPAVRREVALALRGVPIEQCRDLLLTMAAGYDGKDRWYLEALGAACEGKEDALYPEWHRRLGGAPAEWSAAFAGIVWRLRPAAAVGPLAQRAGSAALSAAARRQAVDALAFMKQREAAQAVLELALHGPADVRPYAAWWVRHRDGNDWREFGLARLLGDAPVEDGTGAVGPSAEQLKKLLDPSLPDKEVQQLVAALAATGAGGRTLLSLAARGRLPEKVKLVVARYIFRNPDLGVRALASEYFPRPGAADASLPPVARLAALPGDSRRGRAVFFGEQAACSRCHRFADEGGDVGPDLTQIALKFDRAALLDAVLNPSAAILTGYEAWLITTEKGEVITGFLLSDADPVVLKDSEGRQRSIPRRKIAERQQLKLSLMPDNAAVGLKAEELADLITFLLSRPAAKK
jgi:putative heme-binding domain-containing protein